MMPNEEFTEITTLAAHVADQGVGQSPDPYANLDTDGGAFTAESDAESTEAEAGDLGTVGDLSPPTPSWSTDGVAALLSQFTYTLDLPPLSPDLKTRLHERIQRQTFPMDRPEVEHSPTESAPVASADSSRSTPPQGFQVIRRRELHWQPVGIPGIRLAKLYEDSVQRTLVGLLCADPGAVYPPHRHALGEEIYMLTGDLIIGDWVVAPGDFVRAEPGSLHPLSRTVGGCLFLFRSSLDDTFVAA
ncbi:MAG: hypothetical protein OHK0012_13150 [Synechococcales cyanobacterium]